MSALQTEGKQEGPLYLPAETLKQLFGLSFCVAWIEVLFSGEAFIAPPDTVANAAQTIFPLTALGLAVGLVLVGIWPVKYRSLMMDKRWQVGMTLLGMVVVAGACTPAYIPLWLCEVCSFLNGLASVTVAVRGAMVMSSYNSKTVTLLLSGALVMGTFGYGFGVATSFLIGREATVVYLCLLIPACTYLLSMPSEADEVEIDDYAGKLPAGFWRIAVAVAVFCFACCFVRGFFPMFMSAETFAQVRFATAWAVLLSVFAIMVVIGRMSVRAPYGSICYYSMIVLAALLVLVPLCGMESPASGVIATAVFVVSMLIAWVVLLRTSYRTGAHVIRVFGYGYSLTLAASSIGFTLGDLISQTPMSAAVKFALSLAVSVVAIAAIMALFRKADIEQAMQPSDEGSDVLSFSAEGEASGRAVRLSHSAEASGEGAAAGNDNAPAAASPGEDARGNGHGNEHDAGPEDENAHSDGVGRFQQRCLDVAGRFKLSPRETEVLLLMARGNDAKSISEELVISYATARTHIRNIYRKMDVHNRHDFFEIINGGAKGSPGSNA